jgi:hypothetical protein
MPNARIVPFQVLPIECPWQRGPLHALNHIRISWNYFLNSIQSFPIWRPVLKLVTSRPNRQNHLPNKISNLKWFFLDSLIRLWLPSTYTSRSRLKPLFSQTTLHLAYRTLSYDNLQLTTHFVELFTKHPDLPPRVKWLLAYKLTQKVLPL